MTASTTFRGGRKSYRRKKSWKRDCAISKNVNIKWIASFLTALRLPYRILSAEAFYRHDRLTDYLDRIKDLCDFKIWFFGHYHANERIGEKFVLLYDKVVALADFLRDDGSVFS